MFKRLTLNKVSFFITFLLFLLAVVFCSVFGLSFSPKYPLLVQVFLFFLFLSFTFFLIRTFLSYWMFPRLKLIYKIINDSPKIDKEGDYKLGSSTDLNIINREVLDWAVMKKNELENLKKLEKYRKNFLGNISHELKTPLFSIQGYLHTLLDGGLEDKSINKKYIEKAISNAERLQYIVDDLEVINRLEENSSLEKSEFNLKILIEEVINDLEILAEKKLIKLSIDKSPEHGLWVEADKLKIRQVIENLLTNSIKYGVKEGRTKVSLFDKGRTLKVTVSDNGIGITPKHIKHIFDRFYRVDNSRSRNLGGSGLGLAIVKHILEAHNQSIQVKSEEDKGSSFSFSLPKMKYTTDS